MGMRAMVCVLGGLVLARSTGPASFMTVSLAGDGVSFDQPASIDIRYRVHNPSEADVWVASCDGRLRSELEAWNSGRWVFVGGSHSCPPNLELPTF
ncbi:MAG: hypothetical protein ACREKI_04815 [Gemmatimonadota bacterium]